MTEPANLPLRLRSHLFDSSHLRDRWPRLRFAYTGSGAAVTTVGFSPTTSDHERLYQSMPIVDAARAFLKLESTLKRAEDVNYADCGCWNGRSRLSNRTFHQRRDYPRCSAIISSGKLLEVPSLPMMCFSTCSQDLAVDRV